MPDTAPRFATGNHAEPLDLAERLARYRKRVEREGRRSALERLDRAIDEATQRPKPPLNEP